MGQFPDPRPDPGPHPSKGAYRRRCTAAHGLGPEHPLQDQGEGQGEGQERLVNAAFSAPRHLRVHPLLLTPVALLPAGLPCDSVTHCPCLPSASPPLPSPPTRPPPSSPPRSTPRRSPACAGATSGRRT